MTKQNKRQIKTIKGITINTNNLSYTEFRDVDILTSLVFVDCIFEVPLSFQYSSFQRRLKFVNCVFHKSVTFGEFYKSELCSFVGEDIDFQKCIFHEQVFFDGVKCNGNIRIDSCEFLYESKGWNDYSLSFMSVTVHTYIKLINTKLIGGINFNACRVENIGIIFAAVSVNNPKCKIDFTAVTTGKEISFLACQIECDIMLLDGVNLSQANGHIIFGGEQEFIIDYNFRDLDAETSQETIRRVVSEEFQKNGLTEEIQSIDNVGMTLCVTEGKTVHFIAPAAEHKHVVTVGNNIRANQFLLNYSFIGIELMIAFTKIHTLNLDLNNLTSAGYIMLKYTHIEAPYIAMKNVSCVSDFSWQNVFYKPIDRDGFSDYGIDLSGAQIGGSCFFNNILFDKTENSKSDCIRICMMHANINSQFVLGYFRGINYPTVLKIFLPSSKCKTFNWNYDDHTYMGLDLDDFEFDNMTINYKDPDYKLLYSLMPWYYDGKELKNYLEKFKLFNENQKQVHAIINGEISFLRKCQNMLLVGTDRSSEANKIWRLRNKLRIKYRYHGRHSLSYILSRIGNEITDYGLSSKYIWTALILCFVALCLLNISILFPQKTFAFCIMQSAVQYIPAIDFGDISITAFVSELPWWYRFAIFSARIVGFLLLTILIASFAGFWRGINK